MPGPVFGGLSAGSILIDAAARVGAKWHEMNLDTQSKALQQRQLDEGYAAGASAAKTEGGIPELRPENDLPSIAYNQGLRQGYRVSAAGMIRQGYSEVAQQNPADPAAIDAHTEQLRERFAGLPLGIQNEVAAEIDNLHFRYRDSVAGEKVRRDTEAAKSDALTQLDGLQAESIAAVRSGNGLAAAEAERSRDALLDTMITQGWMTAAQKKALIDKQDAEVTKEAAISHFEATLREQGPEAARTFIDGFRRSADGQISPDQLHSLTSWMDARQADAVRERKRLSDAKRADGIEGMRRDFTDLATAVEDGSAGRAEIESFRERNRGLVSDGGTPLAEAPYRQLLAHIEKKEKAEKKTAESVDRVTAALANPGGGVVSEAKMSQADLDTYYAARVIPKLQAGDPSAETDTISLMRTGRVPGQLQQQVARGLSTDVPPEIRLATARFLDRASRETPTAYQSGFRSEERQKAALLLDYTRLIGDPAAAAQKVDAMTTITPQIREMREATLRSSKDPAGLRTQRDKARKDLDSDSMWSDFNLSDPNVSQPLDAAFDAIYSSAYSITGDPQVAYNDTLKTIREQWGVTQLGDGSKRLMFLAPEKVYGRIDQGADDSEWMQAQLLADVRSVSGVDPARVDDAGVRIVADPRTRDLGTYRVIWADTLTPVYQDGREMRWHPDWDTSPAKAAADAKAAEELAGAKAEREAFIARGGLPAAPGAAPAAAVTSARSAQDEAFGRVMRGER